MAYKGYGKLRVLVVDDFDNFRLTMSQMLEELGMSDVDAAVSGNEALRFSRDKHYDLILCDYNLGRGKNGQQVLEQMRAESRLRHHSLFILVSAESSKSIVMAAYDAEPDAYLTKPITAKALQQRISRLLLQRDELLDINKAMEEGALADAIDLCLEKVAAASRYTAQCQKLLGILYVQTEQYALAERVYTEALQVRALDWAKVGLAKVKRLQGETDTAKKWLQEIIGGNPLCMQAYDELTDTCQQEGNHEEVQAVLAQAVEISPMALLRQQKLAHTAQANNDISTAAKAWRRTVRLGENSCYDRVENHLNYGRSVSELFTENEEQARDLSRDSLRVMETLNSRFELDQQQSLQSKLVQSQMHRGAGNEHRAKELLVDAEQLIADKEIALTLDTELDLVQAWFASGLDEQAKQRLGELAERYKHDDEALQRIDRLLEEPLSDFNRRRVAAINKEGIGLYNAKRFEDAVTCFVQAKRLFPNHIGVHLNLVQALVSEMREFGIDDKHMGLALDALRKVEKQITATHAQFQRYRQLHEMIRTLG